MASKSSIDRPNGATAFATSNSVVVSGVASSGSRVRACFSPTTACDARDNEPRPEREAEHQEVLQDESLRLALRRERVQPGHMAAVAAAASAKSESASGSPSRRGTTSSRKSAGSRARATIATAGRIAPADCRTSSASLRASAQMRAPAAYAFGLHQRRGRRLRACVVRLDLADARARPDQRRRPGPERRATPAATDQAIAIRRGRPHPRAAAPPPWRRRRPRRR